MYVFLECFIGPKCVSFDTSILLSFNSICLQLEEGAEVASGETIKEVVITKEVSTTNGTDTIKAGKADTITKAAMIRVDTTKGTISLVTIKDTINSIR